MTAPAPEPAGGSVEPIVMLIVGLVLITIVITVWP